MTSSMPDSEPFLTIDLVAHSLSLLFLSPFPVILVLFTLFAQGESPHSSLVFWIIAYLIAVCLFQVLQWVDAYLAYGAARKMIWEDEVVLITGGAGGLGGLIAEVYGMRGVQVAVLDIQPATPEFEAELENKGITYFQCDVGDADQVQKVAKRVEEELGPVTILINNAAVLHGKRLLDLTPADIQNTYAVNVQAHYYTLAAFLPGMLARPAGGTIVSVSSVLGSLGCASLSDYTSSKAAATTLHRSITAEVNLLARTPGKYPGAAKVKTILVAPGQLTTPLFARVQPPSAFLGPPVEPARLAARIIQTIDTGRGAEIAEPLYARWIAALDLLPPGLRGLVRRWAGLDLAAWNAFIEPSLAPALVPGSGSDGSSHASGFAPAPARVRPPGVVPRRTTVSVETKLPAAPGIRAREHPTRR